MLITLKNLQQQTFTIYIQPEKTVLELKEAIFKDCGSEYIVEKQKLIYAGVVLEDERTLLSYNVDEKKFLVVMLKRDVGGTKEKQKEFERSTNKPPKNVENSTNEVENKDDDPNSLVHSNFYESTASSYTVPNVPVETIGSTGTLYSHRNIMQSNAESNLLMGEEYERTVTSMTEMGYGREMVEQAMAASFNNPERAVEYLISGIPRESAGLHERVRVTNEYESDTHSNIESGNSFSPNDISHQDPFEFLRNQPQFLQMRSLVYQNPDLLHAVLQQIGQTNPALLQLISENQDAFLNMLNQPVEGQHSNQNSRHIPSTRAQLAAATLAASANDNSNISSSENSSLLTTPTESTVTNPRNRTSLETNNESLLSGQFLNTNPQSTNETMSTIRLTQQDQIAVERLKALGFPEALVLQAYFACEKDEQLAANFLISSSFDD